MTTSSGPALLAGNDSLGAGLANGAAFVGLLVVIWFGLAIAMPKPVKWLVHLVFSVLLGVGLLVASQSH